MRSLRSFVATVAPLLLAACSGHSRDVSDVPVRVGNPYDVHGRRYVPAADPTYDMLGYASWYGNESGKRTANGERFRARWLTAAHRTLPLPTYVEVTALATGRRLVVRINDRGPFVGGDRRIIDLSRQAAATLGLTAGAPAAVRVRIVDPPENERRRLRNGKPTAALPTVPEPILRNLRAQLAAGPP